MMDELLEYYRSIQTNLAREHHGQFVLIHDAEVVGFFPEMKAAYWTAVDEELLEPGSFLIRECISREEETPLTFFSRLR